MSDPETPPPNPGKSRVIVGDKANRNAKPKKGKVHSDYGELDMDSPLLKKTTRRSRGPRSSIFKWTGINVVIKLFRLSVKFIPIGGALAGAIYGYTYFFGSIPIVDSFKKQLGMEVAPQTTEASRVQQILDQTQTAIAASDSRVHLGNAIAVGDNTTVDAIESGELTFKSTEPTAVTPAAVNAQLNRPASRPTAPAGPSVTEQVTDAVSDKIGDMFSSLKTEIADATASESAEPAEPVDTGETIARTMTIETNEESSEDTYAAPAPKRQITIVQNSRLAIRSPYHDVDFRKGPAPSPAFSAWAQTVTIGGVLAEFKPKVKINNMTFVSGNVVDFALGVTLAGISNDGTVVVFRDNRGSHITVPY